MINKDENGIIGQIQPDGSIEGGDSVNWMGHHIYLTDDKDNFPFVETFEVKHGAYVRHPDPKHTINGFGAYYKNPWDGCISRDQFTGILAALIAKKDYKALIRLGLHWSLRLFLFAYNTIYNGQDPSTPERKIPDLTLGETWSIFLRGFGKLSYLFFPILCLIDIQILFSVLFFNSKYYKDDDAISFALRLIIIFNNVKTPTSYLACKLLNKDKMIKFIHSYWECYRANPGMSPLYIKKLEKMR